MDPSNRATVSFDPEIHPRPTAQGDGEGSDRLGLVNDAVQLALGEDAAYLEAFAERRGGPILSFDEVVKDLRRRERI